MCRIEGETMMTEKQWYQKQFGMRFLLWLCSIAGATVVLAKTHSFGWFMVAVLAGTVIRFAPLACRLDELDSKYRESNALRQESPCGDDGANLR